MSGFRSGCYEFQARKSRLDDEDGVSEKRWWRLVGRWKGAVGVIDCEACVRSDGVVIELVAGVDRGWVLSEEDLEVSWWFLIGFWMNGGGYVVFGWCMAEGSLAMGFSLLWWMYGERWVRRQKMKQKPATYGGYVLSVGIFFFFFFSVPFGSCRGE